jgi:hypothetical protein
MLMLYTYRATILNKELDLSYSGDYSVVADTRDDRIALLRRSLHDPFAVSVVRHILIGARSLTLREVSLLDEAMRITLGEQCLYMTHPTVIRSRAGAPANPPRIYAQAEVETADAGAFPRDALWQISPDQYAYCARYRNARSKTRFGTAPLSR